MKNNNNTNNNNTNSSENTSRIISQPNVKVMPSPSEGDGGLQGQLPNDENDSTHSGMGIGHPRLALPLGSSDLDSAWGLLNRVFNFQLRPTAFGRLKWYISKTGNPPSLRSLPSFLIYLPEIEMAQEEMGMSLSELQNHYHQLALALRNHAKSDLMVEVRKQLDKTLHQALLLISPSSPDMDAYIASLQTSANVLRQYVTDRKVHIPFCPTLGDSGMDIHLGEVTPRVSEQAQEPFGNMSPLVIDGVCLGFRKVSFSLENAQVGAPVERVDSPRLDRRDDSFPDFDTVSANTNEFGTHLSFWKHGKSYPEISLPMNLELGQAIFVGLERYVKRHYPNMALFQQECPPSPCSTEPKKQTLFCGLFD